MDELIRTFQDREEEAKFWDNVDLEQIAPGELVDADVVRPARPLSATFAVRLDERSLEQIRSVARARGLGPTQLVRSWVLERLQLERESGCLAERSGGYSDEVESAIRSRVLDAVMRQMPNAAEAAVREVLLRSSDT